MTSERRGRPLRARLLWSAEARCALATMVLTSLAATWVLRLWEMNHRVPLNAQGDATFSEMLIKSLVDNPWYQQNPHLGAPLGQTLYDFPAFTGDHLQVIALKLMTLLTGSVGTLINAYYLGTFPVVALVAFLVLRHLEISRAVALVCASLYSLLAYHFLRGEGHLFLSLYVGAPLGCLLALRVAANEPIVRRALQVRGARAWLTARTLSLIGICVVIGMTGTYFAAFTILLVLAAYLVRGGPAGWRQCLPTVVVIVGAIAVTLVVNNLPNLLYRAAHGPNPVAGVRRPLETEYYALKLTELLLPVPGHRIAALAKLRADYDQTAPPGPSESSFAALGTLASLAFVYLGFVALTAITGRSRALCRPALLRNAAMLTLVAFLLGTLGGISSFISYWISPELHAWNRISTFIAFFAFLAVGLVLDRVRARLGRRTSAFAAILAAIFVAGTLDQTSDGYIPTYQDNLAAWGSTAAYDVMIEHILPRGASVFELPIVGFPEAPPPTSAVGDYDNALPYAQSTGLNWSFGVVKGRPSDWQAALVQDSPAQIVNAAEVTGFQGLSIDRLGYPGDGTVTVAQISQVLGQPPVMSRDGRYAFFDLRAHAARALAGLTPAQLAGQREILLDPLPVTFGPGFFALESAPSGSFRWQGPSATITIANNSRTPRQMSFHAVARTGFQRPSHVSVTLPGTPTLNFDADRRGRPFTFNFTLGAGTSTITIATDAPRVRAPGEHRDLHLQIAEPALSG